MAVGPPKASVFPKSRQGAADDLKKATDIARSIVTRFGMDETLGNVSYEDEPSPFLGVLPGVSPPTTRYSEDTTRKIDEAVRAIIKNAFNRASAIQKQNHDVLDKAAKLLLEHETLDQEALKPFALQMKEHDVLPVALPAA